MILMTQLANMADITARERQNIHADRLGISPSRIFWPGLRGGA